MALRHGARRVSWWMAVGAAGVMVVAGCTHAAGETGSFGGSGTDEVSFQSESGVRVTARIELSVGSAGLRILDPHGRLRYEAATSAGGHPIDIDRWWSGDGGTWRALVTWEDAEGASDIEFRDAR
jgi:hypothetical protein